MNRYGETYSGDTQFVAKCRRKQSVYRADVLNLEIRPYKGRDGIHYYGNYISDGENTGANFLEDYIFEYAKDRVKNREKYETIESDRLFNNLLSSQPMAFNLFCSLRKMVQESPEEATRVISAALPQFHIYEVTEVNLEFIPNNYKQLTGDKSAMDAIIRFKNQEGRECFIAIETKYSENLGTNEASNKEKAFETIREIKCFNPDIEKRIMEKKVRLTQIYRNFLLSETYGRYIDAESYSLMLAPADHPSTDREVRSLSDELSHEYKGKIQSKSLEDFIGSLIANSCGQYAETFKRFKQRYLDL